MKYIIKCDKYVIKCNLMDDDGNVACLYFDGARWRSGRRQAYRYETYRDCLLLMDNPDYVHELEEKIQEIQDNTQRQWLVHTIAITRVE